MEVLYYSIFFETFGHKFQVILKFELIHQPDPD